MTARLIKLFENSPLAVTIHLFIVQRLIIGSGEDADKFEERFKKASLAATVSVF
jgi:hypothetical protein